MMGVPTFKTIPFVPGQPELERPRGEIIAINIDEHGRVVVVGRRPMPEEPMPAPTRDDARRFRQKEENERLQQIAIPLAPTMTVDQMQSNAVWIADGSQVGFMDKPGQVLSFNDFMGFTASCVTSVQTGNGKPKDIPNAVLWKRAVDRKTVHTRTFRAGTDTICVDPDGNVALNSWRPIGRSPSTRDVQPFLDHVTYLIGEDAEIEAFFDWLAHIEQQPGVLPHYGWLHIAKSTGTGRNWLASVLARLWRGYVAPNVDLPNLLSGQFNGQLAGRILAIVDEVQEGGGENPYRHMNKLKSILNEEVRDINPKYGRRFLEHNSCRWLVFSNHENALPLNDTDRRWRVIKHDGTPRSPSYYARLYALLSDVSFINAVGVWLRERDICRFNPGERPPMSAAKRSVVDASKSPIMQSAEQLVALWPADVICNYDIVAVLTDREDGQGEVTSAMRAAIREAGAAPANKRFAARGRKGRGYVLRNHERWSDACASDLSCEASRAVGLALDILQRAQDERDSAFHCHRET